ncbi:MAG: putative ABC transporter C family protein [Streblomastix strix]|uniref:Putative ABC transporter C family protein n=1 Tax=Streblomastix strix TaxID=222440 RepID=A0A5J4VHQ3_9EUKA|nr:MAG: putative ABC transporter C family protein [Streblomastix strix]
MSVMHTVPHYLAVASFASYIAAQKVPQERFAVEVMPTVEYLELMAEPAVNLPMYLQAAMMAVVSFRRIREFINVDYINIRDDYVDEIQINKELDQDYAVSVVDGYFGLNNSKTNFDTLKQKDMINKKEKNHQKYLSSAPQSEVIQLFSLNQQFQCILRGINFNIKRGSLTIVVGSVGSGKSSIGLALIGEMKRMKGSINVNGSVAYCPQNAWITSNSVRGNILFGNAYNESRYKQTIKVCGLEKDLSILPAGDETAVGERGINMSGGQKARIQLARAVYSDRDIYILDDPLSAVDAHVGQRLFQECIDGQLKGKTRILLSNGILEHHAVHADQIIILEKGQIIAQGTLEEIESQGIDISKYMRNKQYDFIMNQNQLIKSPDIQQQDKNTNPDKHPLHHKHIHIVASTDIPPPPPMQNIESTSQEENQQTKTPENSQSNGYHIKKAQSQSSISSVDTQISISSFGATSPSPRLYQQTQISNIIDNHIPMIKENEKSQDQQLKNEFISDKNDTLYQRQDGNVKQLNYIPNSETQKKQQIQTVGKRVLTGEEQATGAIPIRAYLDYARSLAPYLIVLLLLILSASAEAMCLVADYWVGVIGEVEQYSNISYWMKVGIYCIMSTYVLFAMLSRSVIGGYLVKRSSRRVHGKLLSSISKAPSSFYDTTPLGRIINRFTGDLPLIDRELYNTIIHVLNMWFSSISAVIVIAVDTALFLAFGIPVLFLLFIILAIYLRAARNLMRLELMARSPVLSLYNEMTSGAGLPTIRSYGMQQQWRKEFVRLNDEWTIRSILSHEGNLWASIMTGGLTTLFTASVIFLGWMSMSPAKLGVAIGASFRFFELGTHLVEETVQMETRMTSYQRVHFYSNSLPHEIALDDEEYELEDIKKKTNYKQKKYNNLDDSKYLNQFLLQQTDLQKLNKTGICQGKKWPVGSIRFENVYFRYRPGLPFVLRNISLNISNGERIGVCGRTGAGKSSLCFPLFRLIELNPALMPASIDVETGFPKEDEEDINDNSIYQNSFEINSSNYSHIHKHRHKDLNKGRVLIDEVDISKVDLYRLRSCLALIPQDPILFAGSIRTNLDVNSAAISELNQRKYVDNFTKIQMKEDNELWEALKLVHLFTTITELPLKLDTLVTDGGSNFSAGQRQQICLARAILSNSSIIVLDEATSCIDAETDRKIQRTISQQFREKTVITIAHRLETMRECDRVVVIDEGRIIEVGTPEQLQANPNSAFSRLLKSSN